MSKNCGVCGKPIESGVIVEAECLEQLKLESIKLKEYEQMLDEGQLAKVVKCTECKYTSWCVKSARQRGYCSEGVKK